MEQQTWTDQTQHPTQTRQGLCLIWLLNSICHSGAAFKAHDDCEPPPPFPPWSPIPQNKDSGQPSAYPPSRAEGFWRRSSSVCHRAVISLTSSSMVLSFSSCVKSGLHRHCNCHLPCVQPLLRLTATLATDIRHVFQPLLRGAVTLATDICRLFHHC